MGCRSLNRGEKAADDIKKANKGEGSDRMFVRQLDLGLFG